MIICYSFLSFSLLGFIRKLIGLCEIHIYGRGNKWSQFMHKGGSVCREEGKTTRATIELSKVQLNQHKVLLLQQLQPHTTQILLQDLQKVLDRRWVPQKRPSWRWFQEEQEGHHHSFLTSSSRLKPSITNPLIFPKR